MKRKRWTALILAAVVAIVLTSPVLAFPGGVSSSNQQISCDNGKHAGGTATISMGGSPASPGPGQTVTVWINVSGANTGGRLGVMLISSLQGTSSQPSSDGWTIAADPSGTAFNFNERTSAAAGVNTFIWTMSAPASGSHTLYSKAFYAGPAGTTYAQGLTFSVAGGGGGNTSATITSPAAGASVSGTVSVTADLVNTAGISYAVLRIDGAVISNLTAAPFAWSWNTLQYSAGSHIINVTAAGADGTFGYVQRTVTVSNAVTPTLDQIAWQWTAMALLLSSLATISVVLVLVLMVKKRRTGGGS